MYEFGSDREYVISHIIRSTRLGRIYAFYRVWAFECFFVAVLGGWSPQEPAVENDLNIRLIT